MPWGALLALTALGVATIVAHGMTASRAGEAGAHLLVPPPAASPTPPTSAWVWRDGWLRSSIWTVGVDVVPGRYVATVPAGPAGACHWTTYVQRAGAEVLADHGTGLPGRQVTVTIRPGATGALVYDCGWFQPAPGTPAGPPSRQGR